MGSNYESWRQARNEAHPDSPVPDDLFMSTDAAILSLHLSRFVVETRKSNGDYYPPATLHQLMCGLLRHMRTVNPEECPNFLDKKDTRFKQLHGAMDAHFHQLHARGIGQDVKHSEVFLMMKSSNCGQVVYLEQVLPSHYKMQCFTLYRESVLSPWG